MFSQFIALSPVSILQVVFACQMTFSAILIWNLKRYRYLAIFFIFQAVLSATNAFEQINASKQYYLITPVFTLLIGPILYFFIRSLVNEVPLKGSKKWTHFIFALLALPFTEHTQFIIACGTFSQVIYLYLSFQLLARYHNTSKAFISDADRYELTWLVKALAVFTLVTVTDIIRMNLQTVTPESIKALWYFINELLFFSISCFLTFKVIHKPILFEDMTSYEALDEHQSTEDIKAEKTLAIEIFTSINNEILEKKMFKQPRFSVTDLSKSTGINVKDISWAINLASERNFCDYINSLRIDDIKQQLLAGDASNRSLLEIAFASGFNSKSTFNAVFKKEVGKTPSQFIRMNQKSSPSESF
ncbi:helix-turn-helix domain-containing protein [Colwelliaceae bacterium 6471]